jgi:hypothetical protein
MKPTEKFGTVQNFSARKFFDDKNQRFAQPRARLYPATR